MELNNKLIDELLKDYRKPEDMIGENGLLRQLTKALIERAMNAELTHQLGYEKHDPKGYGSGNSRNGTSSKTLKGDFGEIEIEVPRTGTVASSRRSCPNIKPGLWASTTRSYRCTHEA